MQAPTTDQAFAGSIPQVYDACMVPLLFAPYADDLAQRVAQRVAQRQPSRLLEIAAGTGAVTRRLASTLLPSVQIVATDLSQPMLDQAAAIGTARPVEWQQADAMQLPFPDGAFDMVVCQFGVMFLPDKAAAFAEVRRVLGPGGVFLFNVWDRIEHNEFAATVSDALAALYPGDPPQFMQQVPHGYFDTEAIRQDLHRGGFDRAPEIVTVDACSHADSPALAALAFCQGTPMRMQIEARDAAGLTGATNVAARALASRFGADAIDGKMRAYVVAVER
ncbi:ubiquinone/menaquinone biosynthesis C-methylase UbiE [Actimicrobium sp. GrIS 1.19]|uniref:class I SAM-dependent methyltransferase n=1 Tax=Actimicrobium sp. GrIS 1.19 TaxID=3071708 RepID=UPI002DFA878B|nr:ubiquinone/menaquinone biosynthesis C-methylase UbiE [Actimicrobium sp. GrIS 1.19]